MRNKELLLFVLLLSLVIGCNNGQKQPNNLIKEDFNSFYKKFYSDSVFQLSRIIFPLQGKHYKSDEGAFESEELAYWKKEDWKIITNVFPDNDTVIKIDRDTYRRRITKMDTLVIEKVFIENSGYHILQKYTIKNGKWYLGYCDEANF